MGLKRKNVVFTIILIKKNNIYGEIISFTIHDQSYLILISGIESFYKSDDYNTILSNVKPSNSVNNSNTETNHTATELDDKFTRYEFKSYSLSIPKSMELRNENSMMSLGKVIFKDKLQTIKKINYEDAKFVFQPIGTDNVENRENQKKAFALYSRILIYYKEGNKGDYFYWNDSISFNQTEYQEYNKIFKDNLLTEYNNLQASGVNMKIVSISDIEILKNNNQYIYIKQQYERKGLKGNVLVTNFYIFNNDEMVKITTSYRKSEIELWELDFEKIIDTFSFTTKKKEI